MYVKCHNVSVTRATQFLRNDQPDPRQTDQRKCLQVRGRADITIEIFLLSSIANMFLLVDLGLRFPVQNDC